MKQHIITAAVALTTAIGGTVAVHKLSPAPAPIVVTHAGKPLPNAWGELSQAEVDALTGILKTMKPAEVAIFCASRDCEDIALDFDNAFESAHWVSGIERPLVDSNTGINVGPDDEDGKVLAAAIESATNGRIKPGLIASHLLGDRRALVISRPKR
jgi:hypothetical protein